MARYHYYNDLKKRKVICVSSFAGRKVRGVAMCAPDDSFDEEKGKELARARVDREVARRRLARAEARIDEAERLLEEAEIHLYAMQDYYDDAEEEYINATDVVHKLLEEF